MSAECINVQFNEGDLLKKYDTTKLFHYIIYFAINTAFIEHKNYEDNGDSINIFTQNKPNKTSEQQSRQLSIVTDILI